MTGQWWNATTGTGPQPGTSPTSGGPSPLWDPNQGILFFSYGNVTSFKETHVPTALAGIPSLLNIRGYTYSYDIRNQNFDGRQGSTDTITATITMRGNPSSTILDTVTNTYNTKFDWTTFSGTRTLPSPVLPSATGWLGIYFNSRDTGFWAGYYGPQVRNVDVRVNYGVDPCAANPLYASTCPGFNDIVTSGNLMGSNPSVNWGSSFNEIIAISTALQHGGMGVRVHGFEWGYDVKSLDPYCASWFLVCFDNRDPLSRTTVNITNSSGQNVYSVTRDYNDINSWQSKSYSYNLSTSTNSLNLGNFSIQGQTWDDAALQNVYVRAKYTPDQCVLNPLYSTSCNGYAQAYFDQQCSANPLYNQSCPGYAQAYYNQQCSLSALYDSGCPGYAQAYYNQQCSLNALYDSGCPGYAQAYFNQQCSLNPLYNQSCPGYAQAYFNQQCGLNALYNAQCPGYATAKILKDQQEQRSLTSQPAVVSNTTSTKTESSPTVALADPTRTETVVTTDVGGVELTVSGQIYIPTGQPTATKESIKEATLEKKEERKTVNPKHLALAQAAVKDAERTALSTASDAVALSQSESSTSSALGFGPGINVQQRAASTSSESESQTSNSSQNRTQTNPLQGSTTTTLQGQEQTQKNGPSVRNGGKVEGLEGGPDPTQLARTPMDFNQYLQSQLQDSQFYTSKEIYKGQRTVDNARAERFLNGKSDVIHQRMIEQQYNIGN
jgi:hypothetical protein